MSKKVIQPFLAVDKQQQQQQQRSDIDKSIKVFFWW